MTHTWAAYWLLMVLQILTASEVPGKDHVPLMLTVWGKKLQSDLFSSVFLE